MTTYLDNAATSFPKPAAVEQEMRECLSRRGACPGRGSYAMAREAGVILERARRRLAELFNAPDAQRVALAFNATDALNMAIKGALQDGDHVVTTAIEHNSVSRPLYGLEQAGRISVTRVKATREGLIDPDALRRAITPRTRLVAVVHASNVTGALQPIERIGPMVRESGAWLLVDASQTAGSVPIDVQASGIDLLACPGHKGLLGPSGTGALLVGPRVELRPWREGGTGSRSELPGQPDEWPLRLEAGSPNTVGLAGLVGALEEVARRGVEAIRAHEMRLTAQLLDRLRAQHGVRVYGPQRLEQRVAVVSVTIEGADPVDVAERLDQEHDTAVRAGLHCAPGAHEAIGTLPAGTVRISPGPFSTDADIERCAAALEAIARGARRPAPAGLASR